jgi:hypothetical protein
MQRTVFIDVNRDAPTILLDTFDPAPRKPENAILPALACKIVLQLAPGT